MNKLADEAKEVFNDFNRALLDQVKNFTEQISKMKINLSKKEDGVKLDHMIKLVREVDKIRMAITGEKPEPKKVGRKKIEKKDGEPEVEESLTVEQRLKIQ